MAKCALAHKDTEKKLDGESFLGFFLLEVENNFGEFVVIAYTVNLLHLFLDVCIMVIQRRKIVTKGYDVIPQGFC